MSPLECAARAVHQHSFSDRPWESMLAADHARYVEAARAVLQAVHEPTEFATDCGAYKLPGIDQEFKQRKVRQIWQVMIDAILDDC